MKQESNRILLIEPPFYRLFKDTYSLDRHPLSLGYLAGVIKGKTNWDVMSYNSDFNFQSEPMSVSYMATGGFDNYLAGLNDLSKSVWQEIKRTILEYRPIVVGISAKSQNFKSACRVAQLVKQTNKDIIVLIGGPHPSMVSHQVLECSNIDIGLRGEGENTIVELLEAIEDGRNYSLIKGIFYKENGRVIENAPREFIEDLDSICFPHENAPELLKDYSRYPITAFRNIFATRGCPYGCFFCGSHKIWSRKVRFRSPENVVKEIKNLQKIGLKSIHFDDDTFGINNKYISDLCNAIITHCPKLKWSCELHVKLVNERNLSLMKAAGCCSIQIGIESGNNDILKEMRKNITIEEAFSACELIKKYGIELQAFFMVGFPQETEDSLQDTIRAMERIKCDRLVLSTFTPYPGTEAFQLCREKALIDDNYDVSLYNHQSPVNYYCRDIVPQRFRELVSKVEKIVDKKNKRNRIKRIFSLNTFRRIRELGINDSLKKGIKVFFNK